MAPRGEPVVFSSWVWQFWERSLGKNPKPPLLPFHQWCPFPCTISEWVSGSNWTSVRYTAQPLSKLSKNRLESLVFCPFDIVLSFPVNIVDQIKHTSYLAGIGRRLGSLKIRASFWFPMHISQNWLPVLRHTHAHNSDCTSFLYVPALFCHALMIDTNSAKAIIILNCCFHQGTLPRRSVPLLPFNKAGLSASC